MSVTGELPLGVVLLAAGASSRMGAPKLLLPWRGTTVIGHLLGQWQKLGATQITVVVRPGDTALAAELDRLNFFQAERLVNLRPERGMFSSVQCAAAWAGWRADLSHWAIVLGDQPQLTMETLQLLLLCSRQNPSAICQPSCAGRLGHPVILPLTAFAALQNTGAATLKEFLLLPGQVRLACPVTDPGLLLDMDMPADYQQFKTSHNG